jgi:hypothetical protein
MLAHPRSHQSYMANEAALLSAACSYQLLGLENFGHTSILKLHTPHIIACVFFYNCFCSIAASVALSFHKDIVK